jgi:hypothetical protein
VSNHVRSSTVDQNGGQSEQSKLLCTLEPRKRRRCDPSMGHDTRQTAAADSTGLVAGRVPQSPSSIVAISSSVGPTVVPAFLRAEGSRDQQTLACC